VDDHERPHADRTTLRVGSLPGRLASTFETLRRALSRVDGSQSTLAAHAGLGLWRVAIDGAPPDAIATLARSCARRSRSTTATSS